MDESTILKKVQKATEWIATEYKYFKDLQTDLQELKADLNTAKEKDKVRDIKNALADFRYLAKAERRFNRSEEEVEQVLAELKGQFPAAGELQSRLCSWNSFN